MSNEVFQQNLDDQKGPQPGGPFLIQLLFKEPVPMPDKEKMIAVIEKHIGSVECFCHDKKQRASPLRIILQSSRTARLRCS